MTDANSLPYCGLAIGRAALNRAENLTRIRMAKHVSFADIPSRAYRQAGKRESGYEPGGAAATTLVVGSALQTHLMQSTGAGLRGACSNLKAPRRACAAELSLNLLVGRGQIRDLSGVEMKIADATGCCVHRQLSRHIGLHIGCSP